MRFATIAVSLAVLVLTFAPAFGEDVVPQVNVVIAPTGLLPPPPPPNWIEAMQAEAASAVTFTPLEPIKIDFSTPKTPCVTTALAESPTVDVEIRYIPIRNSQYAAAVPEPGGILVFGSGIIGLAAHWQRRRLPRWAVIRKRS